MNDYNKKIIRDASKVTKDYDRSDYYSRLLMEYLESTFVSESLSKHNVELLRTMKELDNDVKVLIIKLRILSLLIQNMYSGDNLMNRIVWDIGKVMSSLSKQRQILFSLIRRLKVAKLTDKDLILAIKHNINKVTSRVERVYSTTYNGYMSMTSLLYYQRYLESMNIDFDEELLSELGDSVTSLKDYNNDIVTKYVNKMLYTINLNHLDTGEVRQNYYNYKNVRVSHDIIGKDFKDDLNSVGIKRLEDDASVLLNNSIQSFVYCLRSNNSNKIMTDATFNSMKKRFYNSSRSDLVYVIFAVKIVSNKLSFKVLGYNGNLTDDFSKMKYMTDKKVIQEEYNKLISRKTKVICSVLNLSDLM